jgi:uncharacterized protein
VRELEQNLRKEDEGPGRFQILSLDGGGYKGIFAAAVLAAFEEDLGDVDIVRHFDLVAGTSTGGIIALALGAGIRPREVVEFYRQNGKQIFSHPRMRSLKRLFRSKYSAGPLRDAVREVFGDRTLGESRCRLIIPSFSLALDGVHIFKTPHADRLTRDWRIPMTDVALSTAAAPTFLPAHALEDLRLIDGGVWANNPTAIAIAEAISMCGANLDSIRVFSLGTTTTVAPRKRHLDRGGIFQWSIPSTDVILRGQSIGAHNLGVHLIGEANILRLDPPAPHGLLRLDRTSTTELVGLARGHSRICLPRFRTMFEDHEAPDYQAFFGPRKVTS